VDINPKQVQNPVGKGQAKVWIDQVIIENDNMIGNQSIDHYATVCLIAGYLSKHNFDVTINHYDDVDIVAQLHSMVLSIEYERSGSHTTAQLLEKKERAIDNYNNSNSRLIFVTTAENKAFVKKAVGNDYCVKRGNELVTFIDNLITGIEADNQVATAKTDVIMV